MPFELIEEPRPVIPALMPTQHEPMAVPCPHCGAAQLFLAGVIMRPADEPMQWWFSLLTGQSDQSAGDPHEGVPRLVLHLQCLRCNGWAWIAMCSGVDDGSWLRFEAVPQSEED